MSPVAVVTDEQRRRWAVQAIAKLREDADNVMGLVLDWHRQDIVQLDLGEVLALKSVINAMTLILEECDEFTQ